MSKDAATAELRELFGIPDALGAAFFDALNNRGLLTFDQNANSYRLVREPDSTTIQEIAEEVMARTAETMKGKR
jgi:hypothetical protein